MILNSGIAYSCPVTWATAGVFKEHPGRLWRDLHDEKPGSLSNHVSELGSRASES